MTSSFNPLMRRLLLALALAATAALVTPAHAGPTSGTVSVAVVSPVPQKTMYNAGTGPNGLTGYVIPLSGADGSYTLTRTDGVGHLDAYFFRAGTGGSIGESCSVQNHDDATVLDPSFATDAIQDGTETGVICPGAEVGKFAIIVARTGANLSFTFSY